MKAERRLLIKHQLGSIVATVVDFSTMIACVELGHVNPVAATALGASCGAFTNFVLGRRWIFQATAGAVHGQAFRYALVSAASLGLNSLGEHLVLRYVGLPYVLARFLVAFVVGITWNYTLQRWFVFAQRPRAI